MKIFGYILITFGFLAGTLVSVLDKEKVNWTLFAAAATIGAAGVVMVRLTHRSKHRNNEKLAANIANITESLERITKNINLLNTEKLSISPYDVKNRIDKLFPDDLTTFVQARQSIAHIYGLRAYAEVMSEYAAGERYLNRVWSASADGYIDEVNTYLDKAKMQFELAFDKVLRLTVQKV